MKHSHLTRPASSPRGFTLIELLVVISIIALLVTGAFGAYGFVMERAKKAAAQATAMTIINAIDQYQSEYDILPQPASATKGTDCTSDTSAAEGLILILKGMDVTQNSRSTDYLGDIKDAKKQSTGQTTKWTDGLVREAETVELYDPWGNFYKVRLDLDMDKEVENPDTDAAASGSTEIHKQAIVWSPGKDMDEMTWKDNVSSWAAAQ